MDATQDGVEEIGGKSYRGVEGWLFFFCFILIFLNPVSTFYQVFAHTLPLISKTHDPRRAILWSVYIVLFVGVSAFGLIAGMRLWMVCAGAVRLARLWLLVFLCAHVAYFFLWLAMFRSTRTSSSAEMGWQHVAGPLVPFFLWNVYLERSRRVRETYG